MPLPCAAFENPRPTPLRHHCSAILYVTPQKHSPKVVDTVAPALHIGYSMSLSDSFTRFMVVKLVGGLVPGRSRKAIYQQNK